MTYGIFPTEGGNLKEVIIQQAKLFSKKIIGRSGNLEYWYFEKLEVKRDYPFNINAIGSKEYQHSFGINFGAINKISNKHYIIPEVKPDMTISNNKNLYKNTVRYIFIYDLSKDRYGVTKNGKQLLSTGKTFKNIFEKVCDVPYFALNSGQTRTFNFGKVNGINNVDNIRIETEIVKFRGKNINELSKDDLYGFYFIVTNFIINDKKELIAEYSNTSTNYGASYGDYSAKVKILELIDNKTNYGISIYGKHVLSDNQINNERLYDTIQINKNLTEDILKKVRFAYNDNSEKSKTNLCVVSRAGKLYVKHIADVDLTNYEIILFNGDILCLSG